MIDNLLTQWTYCQVSHIVSRILDTAVFTVTEHATFQKIHLIKSSWEMVNIDFIKNSQLLFTRYHFNLRYQLLYLLYTVLYLRYSHYFTKYTVSLL